MFRTCSHIFAWIAVSLLDRSGGATTTDHSRPEVACASSSPSVLALSTYLTNQPTAMMSQFVSVNSIPQLRPDPHQILSRPSSSTCDQLIGDVLIAIGVTALTAPFLTIIDKALVQQSFGSHSIATSCVHSTLTMLRNPMQFVRSPTFCIMWFTYGATYSAANCLKTLTDNSTALFVGTTAVNSSASLVKDRAYAKMFGASVQAVPRVSYGLWIARDFTVIGSSFVLPATVAKHLESTIGMEQVDAIKIAQLGTPLVAQLVAGPLHFMGLDHCNRNLSQLSLSQRWTSRWAAVQGSFVEVVAARMLRIIPGYGIAGVLNTELRSKWKAHVAQRPLLASAPSVPRNQRSL
jgi:hypothetical protein